MGDRVSRFSQRGDDIPPDNSVTSDEQESSRAPRPTPLSLAFPLYSFPEDSGEPVIIDNGTGTIKCGFSSEAEPSHIFPNAISEDMTLFGAEAFALENSVCPIEHGLITDWHRMEKIWQYVFSDVLHTDPKKHCVAITEPNLNPKANRERLTESLFETVQVAGLYVASSSVSSLYSSGKTTGIVASAGEGYCAVSPVYEGYGLPLEMTRLNSAGRQITSRLQELLLDRKRICLSRAEAQKMKETLGYVALEFEGERLRSKRRRFTLLDGSEIEVGSERYEAPEFLFTPSLIDAEFDAFPSLVNASILKCDPEIRDDMYQHVVLAGGTTLFEGFEARFRKESEAWKVAEVNIVSPENRGISSWIGTSLFAENSGFPRMWISRGEYEEAGVTIVHRKCF